MSRSILFFLAGSLALAACASRPQPPAIAIPTSQGITAIAAAPPPEEPKVPPKPKVPGGYVELKVSGVGVTKDGPAVFFATMDEATFLPIYIGGTEAMASRRASTRNPSFAP